MRPLLAPRWSQLRRPVTPPTILSHRIRNFHATRPAALVPEMITFAAGYLHGVHTVTGLPWAASIPLAAVGVRTFAAIFIVWQRIILRRRQNIQPLIHCVKKHYQDALRAKAVEDRLYMRPQEAQEQLSRELGKRTADLYKEWKISQTTINVLPLVQFPIWIALMEATRNICGVNMGLLRYLNPMPDKDGGSSLDLPGVEPSLATEGAFWFPNLLAGDPTGILPVILGLTIFTNVRLGFPKMTAAELSDQNKMQMWVSTFLWGAKKGLMFMGAWIALTAYTTGMPAGMMLYWIVSSNTAMLQNMFLDKCLFVSKPLEALPKMEVRILKPGEKPPPVKRLLQ